MDPLSIIVMALVTGAAAALRPTAEQAIKDAYHGIKELIQRKYGTMPFALLETDPASQPRQAVLKEELDKAGAKEDKEVLRQAKALLDSIQAHASEVPQTVGLKLKEITGAALEIEDILAEGTNPIGIELEQSHFRSDITIKKVSVRSRESLPTEKKTANH